MKQRLPAAGGGTAAGQPRAASFCSGPPATAFGPFFFLAALEAIAVMAIELGAQLGILAWPPKDMPAAAWHRDQLLFGVVPAVLAGFLLTALPRWTGSQPVSAPTLRGMAALWLAGQVALVASPVAAGLLAASFIALLALIATCRVVAARDRRNYKVALLLALLVLAAATAGDRPFMSADAYGSRLGLVAILGFVMVLGGRIVPSLTAASLRIPAEAPASRRSKSREAPMAWTTAFALGAWVMVPSHELTAWACAAAAVAQTVRLMQWHGWMTATKPEVMVLHAGYAWIPVGFAMIAIGLFDGAPRPQAALHAWTVGAIGLTCLGVMASMTRRQCGAAFRPSVPLSVAYACGFVAALARVLADVLIGSRIAWLSLAAFAWIAAYALFLFAFGRLVRRRGGAGAT